jgi:uncharacterized protein YciW
VLEREHVPEDPVPGALVQLSRTLTTTPWLIGPEQVAACREAGLAGRAVLIAIHLSAFFNYLTRVADATGIEADYDSPLPALSPDRDRAAPDRPAPDGWPTPVPWADLPGDGVPGARAAWDRWRDYRRTGSASLSAADRRGLAAVAARGCCDAADADPAAEQGLPRPLREFAEKLTLLPWRMGPDDAAGLRAEGWDDAAILQVIAVVAGQNADSRLRFGLTAADREVSATAARSG